jgi:hypothetical protein
LERVQLAQPAPRGRRLVVRLCLFAFCGGLLLLLSSRPAEAAERREPGLLDPVRTTLKATAREVDSFAGRATGSGSSTVGQAANAARQALAPHPRPAPGAARQGVAPLPRPAARVARSAALPTVKRGAPAVPSPVRRAAPPTRSPRPTAKPVTSTLPRAGSPQGALAPVVGLTGPVLWPLAPALAPVGSALAPVGSVLAPVGVVLAPVTGPVVGLVPPLVPGGLLPVPGLVGPGTGSTGGAGPQGTVATSAGSRGGGATGPNAFQTYPARPAADGASSPATRSIRSWPALTGAVSLPGFPTSAELPAGGPDPVSSSPGAGAAMATFAAALLLLGLRGRARCRPDRSGLLSRSYLPLVSPA